MNKKMRKVSKRKLVECKTVPEGNSETYLKSVRQSDEPIPKKTKWVNRQRVLVFCSRGISHRDRHLMEDIKKLMPHHKTESKMERSKSLTIVNEMCEMKNCNKAAMFEGRKKTDLYLWLSNVPNGPSAKFLVENIYTMAELKLTGNCLRGSRPLLSFDATFSEKPHFLLLKELLQQIFAVPNYHPKSQPFFDHVYTFTVLDNRIWFRNYQILSEDGALAEIGPRFVLNPVKIFSGSFEGIPLWDNPFYVSPAKYRQQVRLMSKHKYINRIHQKIYNETQKPKNGYELTPLDDLFKEQPLEKARQLQEAEQKKAVEVEKPVEENKVKKIKKTLKNAENKGKKGGEAQKKAKTTLKCGVKPGNMVKNFMKRKLRKNVKPDTS